MEEAFFTIFLPQFVAKGTNIRNFVDIQFFLHYNYIDYGRLN